MPFHKLIMHFFSSLNDNPLYEYTTVGVSIHLLKEILAHICFHILQLMGFPCGSADKGSTCNVGDLGFDPWVGKIPWRRKRLPRSVFWPGEFHGLQSMESQRVGHHWATFTFALWLMNKAAVNIYVQVLCWYKFLAPLGKYQEVKLLD